MTISVKTTVHKNGTYDIGITCDVSGLPLDQVDSKFGMYCSDPNCKCLAESKSNELMDDKFMRDLIEMFPPNIGDE